MIWSIYYLIFKSKNNMNEFILKFRESSAGKKVLIVVLAVIAFFIALWLIIFIFGVVFLGTGLSDMSKTVSGTAYQVSGNSIGMPYSGGAMMEKQSYSSGRDASAYDYAVAPTIVPSPNSASTGNLPADKKVIKNGSLGMIVEKAEETAGKIQEIAKKYAGFVESSNIYDYSTGNSVKTGGITVRVPEDKFDLAMADIKKLATKVTSENVSSSDVTAQYVDLESSLKNMKAEEAQYREIMARAVKIQDVLDVSSRLADVRGRIERTQGQINYLSRQVAMSTIVVSLTSQAEVEVFGIVWRPLTVLKQAAQNLVSDLAGFVDYLIYLLFKLPILILRLALFVFILWIIWKVGKVAKRRLTSR
jgi:hypothetical protein